MLLCKGGIGWLTDPKKPRIHRLSLTFTIPTSFPPRNEPLKNLVYKYEDTILFTDPLGIPFAGLDPTTTLKYPGFPDLPAAKFTGDGFGGEGKGGTRACIDPEDFVLSEKGGFWVSDEYGPFIYHFTATGKLDMAIRPPNALIPLRKGKESFSSNSPPRYNRKLKPDPARPSSGRNNNQGFEGLTFSRKENALYTMLQSASINDGGANKTNSRYVRLLKYALDRNGKNPKLDGEWVVPLPVFVEKQPLKGPTVPVDPTPMVAPASAIHALEDGRFLVLARDSDRGRGLKKTKSIYRHVDVFSLHNATDIQGKFDDYTSSFAPGGKLLPRISPAKYCSFLDMNLNAELSRFGVSNGGDVDDRENIGLLNEKWEGLAVVPVFGMSKEYFVFVSSDNDFVTQQGHFNFGKDEYRDKSGLDLENQNLVFRIRIE